MEFGNIFKSVFILVLVVGRSEAKNSSGVRFYLYTKKNPETSDIIRACDKTSIEISNFNRHADIKILCHGYLSSYMEAFPQQAKTAYLSLPKDTNVILVDYSILSSATVGLIQASKYVRLVGKQIAKLLNVLVETQDIKLTDVHFIGHSLGAQVGAFISQHLKNDGRIGRISGLDPARNRFPPNTPISKCLDSTDANFVDIIHTTGPNGTGAPEPPKGTVDFYPNGGIEQPGCQDYTCNHSRAYKYFIESITSTVGFKACKCLSWKFAEIGLCGLCKQFTLMGEPVSTRASGVYYLETNASPPFAKG